MVSAQLDIDIDQLTVQERFSLIDRLWDSIPDEQISIPDWHKEELERRIADAQRSPEAGIPWREVIAEMRERK